MENVIDPSYLQWAIVNIGGGLLFGIILAVMKGTNTLNLIRGKIGTAAKQGIKRRFLSFLIRIGFIVFNAYSLYILFTQPDHAKDNEFLILAGLYGLALLFRLVPGRRDHDEENDEDEDRAW